MKKIKKLIVVVSLSLISIILTSCDPMYFKGGRHSYVVFENNSEFDICVYETENYPDTAIRVSYPTWGKFGRVKFGQSAHVAPAPLGDWWEKTFNLKKLEYLSIYIFETSFLEPHISDENFTVNETMSLQRYDLTLEDLNSLNWTISYPPNDQMKYMKMYPLYED